MNTTQQTEEYYVTITANYINLRRFADRNSRAPLHFFDIKEWAPEASTPSEAVATVLARFFGKGAGFIRQIDDTLQVTQPGYDRLGLTLEKAAWKNSKGEASDASVIVPIYKAFVDPTKIAPTSRAAMYRA